MILSPFLGTTTPLAGYGLIDKVWQNRDTETPFSAFLPGKIPAMAHFRKRSGGWSVEIERRGIRESKTFQHKAEAQAWAARREAEIRGGEVGIPNFTLDAVFERYARDVSAKKKGRKWEEDRIALVRRDPLALVRLRDFGKVQVAAWRERRLKAVSAASVRREWNLLNHACNLAVEEWGWLKVNPFKLVKRPADGKARTRIATDAEIATLLERSSPNMARVIRFALETGMRAGEIASLTAEDISGSVATLRDTKNGTSRQVPLSKVALEQLPAPFGLTAGGISCQFTKRCREEPPIVGLTFHDLRRLAITRLAKKLDPLTLAKMVGHRDLKMTLNVYYAVNMADVAALLD